MGGYGRAMRNYAGFSGRASRTEFWQFVAALAGMLFVLGLILGPPQGRSIWPIFLIVLVGLVHLVPGLAVTVRRLHDANRTGWWALLNLIPFGGWIVLLGFGVLPGTPGPNRYGPDPLGGTAPQAGASAAQRDVVGEIERLAQLRASGSLSAAEFEVMKAQALREDRVG